jgi:hypothetical protein
MNAFIKYWDEVIQEWFCDKMDTEQQHYGELVNPNYLPEPYIGNPGQCSFVIVNYNAGGGDNRDSMIYKECARCSKNIESHISYVQKRSYSEVMTQFPFLLTKDELIERELKGIESYSGYKWWQAKRDWINHVAKAANVPNIDDGLMPFAIELCAWHSKSWSDTEILIKEPLKAIVEKRVIDIIIKATKLSKSHFAYFIGKKHIPVLEEFGFHHIWGDTEEVKGEKGTNRFFAIYQQEVSNTKAIVTWTIGSNNHPGKSFFDKEEKVILEIMK